MHLSTSGALKESSYCYWKTGSSHRRDLSYEGRAFFDSFLQAPRRAALYKSLGFLWFLECLAANKAYTMKNSGSPFTIRFISSTDDRFLEICYMSVYYHHLSMNHRVDLGQGAIWSLVLNKPVHRVTQKLFVNIIRPRKFLNLAKYPHNKCSQP